MNLSEKLYINNKQISTNMDNLKNISVVKNINKKENIYFQENLENIFIKFEELDKDDMYDLTIIGNLLDQLEYIFINNIEEKNKLLELYKWKNIFSVIGYDKKCYIFDWINNLYNYCNIK